MQTQRSIAFQLLVGIGLHMSSAPLKWLYEIEVKLLREFGDRDVVNRNITQEN